MKVVVTGGAGFIGANLCRLLVGTPGVDEVVALDDLSTGFRSNLDGVPVELVEGTILDPDTVDRVLDGAGSVIHLGARGSVPRSVADPTASHDANATGTVGVLEGARRAGGVHVVVASSSSVYGANPTLPKQEDLVCRPVSPYAASKLATESYTLAWQHTYGLPTLAFRFFNVFGPLQPAGHAYAAVVPAFVSAAMEGRPLPVHGDGTQSRDFTYVDTVCTVLADAALRQVTDPQPVNLAFGTPDQPAGGHRRTGGDPGPSAGTGLHRVPGGRREAHPGRQHPPPDAVPRRGARRPGGRPPGHGGLVPDAVLTGGCPGRATRPGRLSPPRRPQPVVVGPERPGPLPVAQVHHRRRPTGIQVAQLRRGPAAARPPGRSAGGRTGAAPRPGRTAPRASSRPAAGPCRRSRSGRPDSWISRRARSSIRTGSPMSSTRTSPSWRRAPRPG